jgi:hypothetical protein
MTYQIRYVSAPRDYWIADSLHHTTGVWVHDAALAKQFETETEAKLFLIVNGYDLPANQVVYETT